MSNIINYRRTSSFGGFREVFNTDAGTRYQSVRNGAKISTTHCPALNEFINAGDFGYFDESTGIVSWLKVFTLAEAITTSSEVVKIYQRPYDPVLTATDVIMVAPATSTTTGVAITAGTITAGTVGGLPTANIAITANAIGALSAGALFVIGASAGSGKLPAIPNINVIFPENIEITKPLKTTDFALGYADITCSLYYHATIDKSCVAIPTYVGLLNKMSNSSLWFEL